jgi:tubulin polyglutamylase TTLL6/13
VKPEADCQGRGIFLTQKVEEVENGQHYVVQEYISRPFLVEGLKFDFRVYVLLCGVSPMRIYIYEEGLARFATEPYIPPNKNNLKKQYIHLTNYAINKRNPKFIYNSSNQRMDIGHKRALTSVLKLIEKRGYDLQEVKNNINEAIVKTLLLGHPLVAHQYRFCQPHDEQRNMCFHLLGIDVMLDSDCRPYVLEVNHTPSFVTDTPLDYHIKYALIKDTLTLMNITPQSRAEALERVAKIKS